MNNGFSVAFGAVLMTTGLQLFAQFLVVVNFAVENDPKRPVFICDRLVTGLNVDDAKAAHGQSDILLDKETGVIGPAMSDLPVHRHQRVATNGLRPIGMKNAADSTHD
jgi:hypothetical protein